MMVMEKEEIYSKIIEYLVEYFEIPLENITPEANFYTDLDLDSIDAVDLIVKLQEITNKQIDPNDFKEIRTVQNVVDHVYKLLHD
ncbi:MAG TPA: acyl carrier protein [Holosporales bacterium]|nr:acyl carrier protein [Holosporales bacterium]